MDQVTTGAAPDDEELEQFGYRQQFVRSLRHFESFAVAFSFISITTGIFTTYAFALATGGTRSIWTWPIVIAGQSLVALVYARCRSGPAVRLLLPVGVPAGRAAGCWPGTASLPVPRSHLDHRRCNRGLTSHLGMRLGKAYLSSVRPAR